MRNISTAKTPKTLSERETGRQREGRGGGVKVRSRDTYTREKYTERQTGYRVIEKTHTERRSKTDRHRQINTYILNTYTDRHIEIQISREKPFHL